MAKGLTNDYLENITFKFIGSSFLGVYPCDAHPKIPKKNFSIIFNTGKKDSDGEHFIAISVSNKKAFYFDPFGERPANADIIKFLSSLERTFTWNKIKIQHEVSSFCGFYCLAYLVSLKRRISFSRFKNLFSIRNLKQNDKKVIEFLTK